MFQKVVLRVASLTRTLSVDTLFGDRAHRLLHVSGLLLEASRHRHDSGKRLAERRNEASLHTRCGNTSVIGNTRHRLFGRALELCHS